MGTRPRARAGATGRGQRPPPRRSPAARAITRAAQRGNAPAHASARAPDPRHRPRTTARVVPVGAGVGSGDSFPAARASARRGSAWERASAQERARRVVVRDPIPVPTGRACDHASGSARERAGAGKRAGAGSASWPRTTARVVPAGAGVGSADSFPAARASARRGSAWERASAQERTRRVVVRDPAPAPTGRARGSARKHASVQERGRRILVTCHAPRHASSRWAPGWGRVTRSLPRVRARAANQHGNAPARKSGRDGSWSETPPRRPPAARAITRAARRGNAAAQARARAPDPRHRPRTTARVVPVGAGVGSGDSFPAARASARRGSAWERARAQERARRVVVRDPRPGAHRDRPHTGAAPCARAGFR
jgi:hypothetical protein